MEIFLVIEVEVPGYIEIADAFAQFSAKGTCLRSRVREPALAH